MIIDGHQGEYSIFSCMYQVLSNHSWHNTEQAPNYRICMFYSYLRQCKLTHFLLWCKSKSVKLRICNENITVNATSATRYTNTYQCILSFDENTRPLNSWSRFCRGDKVQHCHTLHRVFQCMSWQKNIQFLQTPKSRMCQKYYLHYTDHVWLVGNRLKYQYILKI